MKKFIVVNYSRKGSNKYLAEKTAEALQCDVITLKPRLSPFFFLLISSATKISLGNRALKHDFSKYDSVILCGPIWMGQFISPLYDFVKKYGRDIRKLSFITCCGSTDAAKNDKFGYATVFPEIKKMMGGKCGNCEAFPIGLIIADDKKNNDQAMMNTRLSDSNFTGEIKTRFDEFIKSEQL